MEILINHLTNSGGITLSPEFWPTIAAGLPRSGAPPVLMVIVKKAKEVIQGDGELVKETLPARKSSLA